MITRPIEIVGGGLAGLSLGLALRRANVPTTIIEAGEYPRHRVCGEFITGLDDPTINSLGLSPFLAGARRHAETAWFAPGRKPWIQRLPAPALGICRHTLDARLADAFIAAGGTLRTGTRSNDESPRIGRVWATGRRRSGSEWVGLKMHVRGLDPLRSLELHLGNAAYVGVAAVDTGALNVCGLFRRRPVAPCRKGDAGRGDVLVRYLEACGLGDLARRLIDAEPVADSFCAVAALDFSAASPRPDEVRVGDALTMIPPFTGNGMAIAFQSAAAAAGPLQEFATGTLTWPQACRQCQRAMARRFRVRLASASILHPFLLRPRRQRWLTLLATAKLLPFRPLYALLH